MRDGMPGIASFPASRTDEVQGGYKGLIRYLAPRSLDRELSIRFLQANVFRRVCFYVFGASCSAVLFCITVSCRDRDGNGGYHARNPVLQAEVSHLFVFASSPICRLRKGHLCSHLLCALFDCPERQKTLFVSVCTGRLSMASVRQGVSSCPGCLFSSPTGSSVEHRFSVFMRFESVFAG